MSRLVDQNSQQALVTVGAPGLKCRRNSMQYLTIMVLKYRIPWILAVFANPESGDWRRLYLRISGLQNSLKLYCFRMSNDRKKNFSRLISKIFYERQSRTRCCVL